MRPVLKLLFLTALTLLLFTACDEASPPAPFQLPTSTFQATLIGTKSSLPTAITIATPTGAPTIRQLEPTISVSVAQPQHPSPFQQALPVQPQATEQAYALAMTKTPLSTATLHALAPIHLPPTSTVASVHNAQVEVIATGFGSPDDLVVAPSGDIFFGDFGNNAINLISASSPAGALPRVFASGLNEPEGMVVAADGAIIVAEQKTNRIVEVNPRTGQTEVLRQLVNRTGKDGVDGLGIDPTTDSILIPDSPNGRILRMSRNGKVLQTVATGFVRPTGAAMEPGGSILVADELGNAVYRLQPNGTRVKLASIYQPDDVIVGPDGTVYTNSLNGTIVRIDPITGRIHVIISGLKLPHGLDMDSQGRLVIAEAGRNRIFRLMP